MGGANSDSDENHIEAPADNQTVGSIAASGAHEPRGAGDAGAIVGSAPAATRGGTPALGALPDPHSQPGRRRCGHV